MKDWIGSRVEVQLNPHTADGHRVNIPNPEGILREISPTMLQIETEDHMVLVLMAHVVTIHKAKETT